MLPSLQPTRPKPPQQPGTTTYAAQQQRPSSHQQPQKQPAPTTRAQAFYDSAVRHPVFMTQTLLKPPFPVGSGAGAAAWRSPVASGYIWERGGGMKTEGRTKL